MNRLPLWLVALLPAIASLLVPVVGYFFIIVLVAELREARQVAAEASANRIAEWISERGDVDTLLNPAGVLVSTPITTPIHLDGQSGDWHVVPPVSPETQDLLLANEVFVSTSLAYTLRIANNPQFVYLFVDVADNSVVYREIGHPSVHRNDHVRIALVGPDNRFRQFTFAAFQPGAIAAAEVGSGGRSLREDPDMEAFWRATVSGYALEVRLPRRALTERFSLAVADVDDSSARQLRYLLGEAPLSAPADLGYVSFSLDEVRRAFAALPHDRVRLFDTAGNSMLDVEKTLLVPADEMDTPPLPVTGSAAIAPDANSQARIVVTTNTLDLMLMTERLVNALVLGSAIIIAFALMLSLLMGMHLSRRVNEFTGKLTGAVDASGRLVSKVNWDKSSDEFGELAETLEALLGRVESHSDYLEKMASRMNHELRTPISVVKSSLENLEAQAVTEQQRTYVDRAKQGIKRLNNIVSKMSEARRLEESLDADEIHAFDLVDVVKGCVAGYEVAYPEMQFDLRLETDKAPITGIPELIAQLLDKLVDNAVSFSADGAVRVRLHREQQMIHLRILNAGASLSLTDDDEDLFASMVSKRRGDGDGTHLGLGLFVANIIARFHGADLSLTNREDEEGVVATLSIPVMRVTSRLR